MIYKRHILLQAVLCTFALSPLLPHFIQAQTRPDHIRGYKVYDAKIVVANTGEKQPDDDTNDAYVKLGDPQIVNVGLAGVTLDIDAVGSAMRRTGHVDFMTFEDFRVNGMAVDIEEYQHQFDFKDGQPLVLPTPTRLFIKGGDLAKAAVGDFFDPKPKWPVTGTVYVFGSFKKFGFSFKRVVPVKIDVMIANPLIAFKRKLR